MIITILLLLLVGVFLGYKIYYANYYDLNHIENFKKIKENFVITEDTITIKVNRLSEEEYLVFKKMKIKNIFEGWERKYDSDEFHHIDGIDSVWYILKDDKTGKGIAALGIAQGPSLFEEFKGDMYIFGDERVEETKDMAKFFEKYNITNDIEYYKYIEKTKNDENSIFDSVKDMKYFYSSHLLNASINTNTEGITLINGDYEGYMVNHNLSGVYIKEYNILIDGKRYTLTFNGLEYFTDKKIQDLLNTLIIE